MKKRDFLKNMASIAAVGNLGKWNLLYEHGQTLSLHPVTSVIYDQRYSDARIYADILIRQHAIAVTINTDVRER